MHVLHSFSLHFLEEKVSQIYSYCAKFLYVLTTEVRLLIDAGPDKHQIFFLNKEDTQ